MDIAIIGYGVVGKAVHTGFKSKCVTHVYDPLYNSGAPANLPENTHCAPSIKEAWAASRFVFICVPTPVDESGRFDDAIIDETMQQLAEFEANNNQVLIIKSTVIPTKIREYIDAYPALNLVVAPEYLVEKNPPEQFMQQEFRIFGGSPEHTQAVKELFEQHSDCVPFELCACDAVGAALLKYTTNSFLPIKVSYLNQIKELYDELDVGTNWEELMKGLHLDPRIGTSHYLIPGPDGKPGWGGRCFPKDTSALVQMGEKLGCDLSLLVAARAYNKKTRPNKK